VHIHLSHHPKGTFVSVPISFAWQAKELSPYRKCSRLRQAKIMCKMAICKQKMDRSSWKWCTMMG